MDTPDKVSGRVASNHRSPSASYTTPPPAAYWRPQNAPSTVMDLESHPTEDRSHRAASVLSMDDLEAAQALEGLRSGGYTQAFVGNRACWRKKKNIWLTELLVVQISDILLEHHGRLYLHPQILHNQNHYCRC